MKTFIKTLLFIGFVASSAEASTEVITEVITNSGSSSYATGSVEGVVDLDGRTLIEGNIVTPAVTYALDESKNVSGKSSGCETAVNGSGTGGLCTLSGISSIEYTIVGDELHYTISTYGGWMPSPYNPGINGVNVTVDLQLSFEEGSASLFDPADRSINLEFGNTEWVDIHYTINGSVLYNYRMIKQGDTFSHQIPLAIENGDVIDYFTTSKAQGAGAIDSAWDSFEVDGLPEAFGGWFDGTTFYAENGTEMDFVDVHYSVNGSLLYNFSMAGDGHDHSVVILPEIQSGDQVDYFFTYSVDGIATDTAYQSYTVE